MESDWQPIHDFYHSLRREPDRLLTDRDRGAARFLESALGGSPLQQELVAELILQMPARLKPDSVGEYLYSCLQPSPETACSPACLKGLSVPGRLPCPHAVWERRSTGLHRWGGGLPATTRDGLPANMGGTDSESAIVYATPPLQSAEIRILSQAGIRRVQLRALGTGQVLEEMELDPTALDATASISDPSGTQHTDTASQHIDFSFWLYLILIAVVIIVLILAIWLYWRGAKPAPEPDPAVVDQELKLEFLRGY